MDKGFVSGNQNRAQTSRGPDSQQPAHATAAWVRPPSDFARRVDAGAVLESFLVAAVATILVTRLYLELTGFPKIGGGEIHFAHLLWGGLLMLVAEVLLLAFLGRHARHVAAIVGGVGFGLFIDELGKFITADNDYFFRPAIALIYLVFIVLFLAFRAIEQSSHSPEELLANAGAMVGEVILGGASHTQAARALHLLDRSGAQGPVAEGIREAIRGAVEVPDRPRTWLVRMAAHGWRLYDDLLAWSWFERVVLGVFVVQAILSVLLAVPLVGVSVGSAGPGAGPLDLGGLPSSLASLGLVVAGVVSLRSSRLATYHWFERAVLVSIFFTQVIQFWQNQLAALGWLIWNLLLLAMLRYMIRQEDVHEAVASLGDDGSRLVQPRPVVL